MKLLLALSLVFYTVNGFNLFHDEEISSLATSCVGIPDGTRLPHETECGRFILCDGGVGLTLTCRSSDPYFDRCNSACVKDMSVCQIRDCPGATTTTGTTVTTTTSGTTTSGTTTTTTGTTTTPSTTTTTTTGTTTTPQTTTTSTTTSGTTTSRFNPPTVPIGCTPACSCTDTTTFCGCECVEQWQCDAATKVCKCNQEYVCPLPLAECGAADKCGCVDNCECSDPDTKLLCTCIGDPLDCPFDRTTQCVARCECMERCDSTVCTETATPGTYTCTGCNDAKVCKFDKTECQAKCGCTNNCDCDLDTNKCTCFDTCKCVEPPQVCPFAPAECNSRCGCEKRCDCNGQFCRCNGDVSCTRNSFWSY